ncbi:MAG: alginate lyase family protein, partial [Candidatus Bathyarchaeia archaeon]
LGETLHLAEIAKWLVFAYDCIEDLLSPEEHGHILRYFFWLTDLTEPYVDTTASNWDVVEAAGLAWLAVRFNYLSGTRRKIERVVNVLKEQMNFIRSDGGWTEGAPGYHQLTLSNFMMASEALLKIGINLYDYSIEEKSFHSMIKWVMLMSTPYLRMPALEDSGHGPPSADIFILGAARYKDAAFLQFALKLAEKGVQPMDPIALSNYPFDLKPKPAEIPISQVLTGTGRILLRSGHEADGHYFILDYGPHGHGHGHPDKLSLELHAFSVPLVIDAGAGLYESTIHRTWHRHTRSHNTVMVDDESQRFTEGELLLFQSLPKSDFAQAAANVYEGIHHTRSVAYLRKQFFVISDVLESNRKHKFTWLLHPNFLPHQGNEGYCFEGPEREGLCVVPLDPSEVKDVELLEEPLLARRRRKGSRRRYLSWEKAAEPGRVYFNAVLIPYKGKMPKLKAEIGDSDGVAVIRVEKDGESYRIVFNCTCGEFATEELKSDASMLIQTGKDYLAAAKVREIKLMERFALKSMEVLAGLELDLRENQIVIRSEKPTKVQLKLADLKEVEADVEYAEKEGQLELKVDPGETRIRLFVEE